MALSNLGLTEDAAVYILRSYLHGFILETLAYGIYTAVYFFTLYLTLSRGTDKHHVLSSVLISILWILITAHAVVRWILTDNAFIRHAYSREDQMQAIISKRLSLDLTGYIVSFLSVLFADATMIWRCWVLHGRRWITVIIPILSLMLGTAAHILRSVIFFASEGVEIPVTQSTWQIIFLATTVFTNIYCTSAIIYGIVSLNGFIKAFRTYHGILEILIESAIMYTAIYLVQIGLDVYTTYFTTKWDTRYFYAQALATVITGIAPTLIIARVARGHARPEDSWTLPRIQITTQSAEGSLRFAYIVNDSDTDLEMNAVNQDSREALELQLQSKDTSILGK